MMIDKELRDKFSDNLRMTYHMLSTKTQNIIDIFRMKSRTSVFFRPMEKCNL